MPYIHDPYPQLSHRPHQRLTGLGQAGVAGSSLVAIGALAFALYWGVKVLAEPPPKRKNRWA